ncbi:hypothetical protein [Sphingomonas hylomeconis]|uniref:Uncharacterized protein n=1 Tax=Sphingomonas hylomeconis TaxID=1395958 RepID=A0ABV7SRG0_9SPHN|nr:hypothetical protein [Sphingomonas hylomeconis]
MTVAGTVDFIVPEFAGAAPLGYVRDMPFFANDTAWAAHSPQTARYADQVAYNGLSDLYYNGRGLTEVIGDAAAGRKSDHFLGCFNSYQRTTYTADQLAAAGTPNEYTVMWVGLAPFTGGTVVTSIGSKEAQVGNGRRVLVESSSSFNAFTKLYYDGGVVTGGPGGPAPGTWRDTQELCIGVAVDIAGASILLAFAGQVYSSRLNFPAGSVPVIGGPQMAFGYSNVNTPILTRSRLEILDTKARSVEEMTAMYFDQLRPEAAADGSNV